ncbi:hypothetical protein WA026_006715, partial [Henosepilachna vigintioctopunctata]
FKLSFKSFVDIIHDAFEACCPLKKITNSTDQRKKWITPEIIRAKHDLKNLYWLYVNLKCQYTFDLYKKAKVSYSSLVSNSRFNYHSELIDQSENKNKTIWWLVSELTGHKVKKQQSAELVVDGVSFRETDELSEIFADYFSTVAETSINRYYVQHMYYFSHVEYEFFLLSTLKARSGRGHKCTQKQKMYW